MRIVHYTPATHRSLAPVFGSSQALATLENEMDRLLGSAFGGLETSTRLNHAPLDLYEDKNNIYVRAELPGVRKEDINIEIVDGYLNLQAVRKETRGEKEESYTLNRSVCLTEEIRGDAVSATQENGILTITLPKKEEAKPRKISVSVN